MVIILKHNSKNMFTVVNVYFYPTYSNSKSRRKWNLKQEKIRDKKLIKSYFVITWRMKEARSEISIFFARELFCL